MVKVALHPHGDGISTRRLTVLARPRAGGVPVEGVASSDREIQLALGAGAWDVHCVADDVWCLPLALGDNDISVQELNVFPASRLSGRVRPRRGEPLPPAVLVQATAETASGKRVDLTQSVSLTGNRFDLTLPRGKLDLRLSAAGAMPLYIWRIELTPRPFDVGAYELRPGSSVSGIAVDPSSRAGIPDVEVAITPLLEAGTRREEERSRVLRTVTRSNARGFFQFASVAPGRYRLDLRGGGGVAASVDAVEVSPDAETSLASIPLVLPVQVEVAVSPPTLPDGSSWSLNLMPRNTAGAMSSPRLAHAGEDGLAHFSGLTPGAYRLHVSDAAGSRLVVREEHIHSDHRIEVVVPLVRVRGRVRLGTRPLEAQVVIRTGSGDESRLSSDLNGEFEGVLREPHLSWLSVEILSQAPRVHRRGLEFRDVETKEGVITLDVKVPDKRVSGRVVDDGAQAVAGAAVFAEGSMLDRVEVESDEHGRFELLGLSGQRYRLWAAAPDFAPSVPIEADPSRDGAFTIVLERGRRLRGQILAAEGRGLPGAQVAMTFAGRAPGFRSATTDIEGRFSLVAPAGAGVALLDVRAPDYLLWSACTALRETDVQEVVVALPPLPPATLKLRVRLADASAPPRTDGQIVLLREGGGAWPLSSLRNWLPLVGGRVDPERGRDEEGRPYVETTVPGLAGGSFALTWMPLPWDEAVRQTCLVGSPRDVSWTTAPAGSEATIVYDMAELKRATTR